ncbi:MAG: 5-oxoprolinase subunit B family protein, partial [Janthinobacterium lividum]
YFLGFQPGFAYLGGLDPRLHTPRHATPRLQVPAGSVGIGGEQTGVYPAVSPGGWQLVGYSDLPFFDAQREPPCLMQPGDQVRFTIASVTA